MSYFVLGVILVFAVFGLLALLVGPADDGAPKRLGNNLVRYVLLIASSFVSALLLFLALLSMQQGRTDPMRESPDADDRRLGTVRAVVRGLLVPPSREFQFGGKSGGASDAHQGLVPLVIAPAIGEQRLATVTEDQLVLMNGMSDDRVLFAEATITSMDGRVQELKPISTVPLVPGLIFCVVETPKLACDEELVYWKVGDDRTLLVSLLGSDGVRVEKPACPLIGSSRRIGKQRILPLEVFGRLDCQGSPIRLFDHRLRDAPFVFIRYADGSNPELSVAKLSDLTPRHVVVSGIGAVGSAEIRVGRSAGDIVDLKLMSVRLSEFVYRQTYEFTDVEIGYSRVSQLSAFRISQAGQLGTLIVPTSSYAAHIADIRPIDACRLLSEFEIVGARGGTGLNEIRVAMLDDLAQIGAGGAQLAIARKLDPEGKSGCSGLGPALITLTTPQGAFTSPANGGTFEIGEQAQGKLLVQVNELVIPKWGFLFFALFVSLLRAILRWRCADAFCASTVMVLMLVDLLLVFRLVAACQEIILNVSEPNVVQNALVALILVPITLDALLVVYAGTSQRFLSRSKGPHQTESRGWLARLTSPKSIRTLLLCQCAIHVPLSVAGESIGGIRSSVVVMPTIALVFGLIMYAYLAHAAPASGTPGDSGDDRRSDDATSEREQRSGERIGAWIVTAGVGESPAKSIASWVVDRLRPLYKLFLLFLDHPIASLLLAALLFLVASDLGAIICCLIGLALWAGYLVVRQRHSGPEAGHRVPRNVLAIIALLLPSLIYCAALWLLADNRADWGWIVWPPSHLLVIGLLAMGGIVWRCKRRRDAILVYAATACLTFLSLGYKASVASTSLDCPLEPPSELASCLEDRRLSRNELRIARLFAPEVGLRSNSREAVGVNQVFDELTWQVDNRSGWWGRGFMTVGPRYGLDKFDNAFATHLIGAFGQAIAWVYLIILAGFLGWSWWRSSGRKATRSDYVAASAMTVFCFTSMYMIAANLQLVFFTGRNVYLTGALSESDLLEGLALLILVLVANRNRGSRC